MRNTLHQLATLTLILLFSNALMAQNGVGINTDNSNPDPSAMLDVKSTTQGVLVPRMTEAEKLAIPSPATGLLIYQSDNSLGFWYFDGTVWQPITGNPNSGWDVNGNAGTTNGTNFVGTTDAQDIDIRTNNVIHTRITQKGQIEVLNTGRSVFLGEAAGANDDLSNNYNSFLGYYSGNSNTTGYQNSALGDQSLRLNTTGYRNSASGARALYNNTTGDYNTATGFYGLYANSTGNYNTANGAYALRYNTGSYNTATGYYALFYNTASYNTAHGYRALYSNTTGSSNVAVGADPLYANTTGYQNTAVGNRALYSNTSGYRNSAFGYRALHQNTTGDYNTAAGYYALYYNTTGNGNVGVGADAFRSNTSGSENTGVGNRAGYDNTTGYRNTAIGREAMERNTTGNYNVAVGYQAYELGNGNGNVAVGSYALDGNTTGSYNTALGYNAYSTGNYSRSTAIGWNAPMPGSDRVRIGATSIVSIGGYANWTNVSDGRFKINVQEVVPGLAFINKLRPVTYNLDMDAIATVLQTPDSMRSEEADINKAAQVQTGFIAQEVEQAAKDLGYDFSGVEAPLHEQDHYGLRYAEFTVPLVKAVQELAQKNENLTAVNQQLKANNEAMKQKLEQSQADLEELKQLQAELSEIKALLNAKASK